MEDHDARSEDGTLPDSYAGGGIGWCYLLHQAGKAAETAESHTDAATRERALARVEKLRRAAEGIASGLVAPGSRAPIAGLPSWVTPEVVVGGFATGVALAGGPLLPHEEELFRALDREPSEDRTPLNEFFLSEAGFRLLAELLDSRNYRAGVAEECALLAVVWLATNDRASEASQILDAIRPYFDRLRFYPEPTEQTAHTDAELRVSVASKEAVIASLREARPHEPLRRQRAAVEVWAPFHDRVVGMVLEAREADPHLKDFSDEWKERATALLAEFDQLADENTPCGKAFRPKGHQAQLRRFLHRCVNRPRNVSDAERRQAAHILECYLNKRGAPDSDECRAIRERARADVSGPDHSTLRRLGAERLEQVDGLLHAESWESVMGRVTAAEADRWSVPSGISVEDLLHRRVRRCVTGTVEQLRDLGLITSSDMMASLLTAETARLVGTSYAEPRLRSLMETTFAAYKRRRSLLLLNLESQVSFSELPWVRALDDFRSPAEETKAATAAMLRRRAWQAIEWFPSAPPSNTLISIYQEVARRAGLSLVLTPQLAADIFESSFGDRFVTALEHAAEVMRGTLYARYYAIDYDAILSRVGNESAPRSSAKLLERVRPGRAKTRGDVLAAICAERAGSGLREWSVVGNGRIIEQQQILTTHNLAQLFREFGFRDEVPEERWLGITHSCLGEALQLLLRTAPHQHAAMIRVIHAATAWRHGLFFLSMCREAAQRDLVEQVVEAYASLPEDDSSRIAPALGGLKNAIAGKRVEEQFSADRRKGAQLLGWGGVDQWGKWARPE